MTLAVGAAIFLSAASACSAFDSWMTPSAAFSTTMAAMATASTVSPIKMLTAAAAIRMKIRKLFELIQQHADEAGPRPFGQLIGAHLVQALCGLLKGEPAVEACLEQVGDLIDRWCMGAWVLIIVSK